ncbi:MAG: nuclear transport factor 2 family protein [Alphaproteobacteria bacterium]
MAALTACSVEERGALEAVAIAYCRAVDRIGDVDGVLDLFTPDAVYDLSGIGMGEFAGHEGIRGFFEAAFPTMAHAAHYVSNFAVLAFDGPSAEAEGYVHAFARNVDGSMIDVKACYRFAFALDDAGWKISGLSIRLLLPPAS